LKKGEDVREHLVSTSETAAYCHSFSTESALSRANVLGEGVPAPRDLIAHSLIAQSPIARALIHLAHRKTRGGIAIGDRVVLYDAGQVYHVRPRAEDATLVRVLIDHEILNITDDKASQLLTSRPHERDLRNCLQTEYGVSEDIIRLHTMKLWTVRLVDSIGREERRAGEPHIVVTQDLVQDAIQVPVVWLVLDALCLRMKSRIDTIGLDARLFFEWLDVAYVDQAQSWLGSLSFGDGETWDGLRKKDSLRGARVLALIRSGFARLVDPAAKAPPPPARPQTLTPTSRSVSTPNKLPWKEDSHDATPPYADLRSENAQPLLASLRRFPHFQGPLEDPLDPLEQQIAALEQRAAEASERALAWKQLAEFWHEYYGSIEEAARAYREAVAADPYDVEALEKASRLTAALGQTELAYRYGEVWVSAVSDKPCAAAAHRFLAELSVRLGDMHATLRSLRAAVEHEPEEPRHLESLARALEENGFRYEMSNYALRAVTLWSRQRRDRALSLAAWVYHASPPQLKNAQVYAQLLAQHGLYEACIFTLTRAALQLDEVANKDILVLEAADYAERAARPDLAAHCLHQVFTRNETLDVLYQPLISHLLAADQTTEACVFAEEIALSCNLELKSTWYARAAELFERFTDDCAYAFELYAEALITATSRESIKATAAKLLSFVNGKLDLQRILDAAERMMVKRPELIETVVEAFNSLDDDHRPIATFDVRRRIPKSKSYAAMSPATGATSPLFEDKDTRLHTQSPVFLSLALDPNQRTEALALGRKLRDANLLEHGELHALQQLLWICGQDAERADLLSLSNNDVADKLLAARVYRALHQRDKSERLCHDVIETSKDHYEAVVRLEASACAQHNSRHLRAALIRKIELQRQPLARSESHAKLAWLCEEHGEIQLAITHALTSLKYDPRNAQGAELIVRYASSIDESKKTEALVKARTAWGDSTRILSLLCTSAVNTHHETLALEAAERWFELAPYDSRACTAYLDVQNRYGNLVSLRRASRRTRGKGRLHRESFSAITSVAKQFAELGEYSEACDLVMHTLDQTGSLDSGLTASALTYARKCSRVRSTVDALERMISSCYGGARLPPLRELASVYRAKKDTAGESRALLRILTIRPHDSETLTRLADIYAMSGKDDRLIAVLTLRVEGATTSAERAQGLLDLAAAEYHVQGDAAAAESCILRIIEDDEETSSWLTAAGALVAIERTYEAVRLLRTQAQKQASAPLYERAVQIAMSISGDYPLAYKVCTEGLERCGVHENLESLRSQIKSWLERNAPRSASQAPVTSGSFFSVENTRVVPKQTPASPVNEDRLTPGEKSHATEPEPAGGEAELITNESVPNKTHANGEQPSAPEPLDAKLDALITCYLDRPQDFFVLEEFRDASMRENVESWSSIATQVLAAFGETHASAVFPAISVAAIQNILEAHQRNQPIAFVLLQLIWEHTTAYVQDIATLTNLDNRKAVSSTNFPWSEPFAEICAQLGISPCPVWLGNADFIHRNATWGLEQIRTKPSGFVISPLVDGPRASLLFRFAYVLTSLKDTYILACTLPREELTTLVLGAYAAFGATDDSTLSPSISAAAVRLRNLLPSGVQRRMRDILVETEDIPFDYERLVNDANTACVLTGLAACGNLNVALSELQKLTSNHASQLHFSEPLRVLLRLIFKENIWQSVSPISKGLPFGL